MIWDCPKTVYPQVTGGFPVNGELNSWMVPPLWTSPGVCASGSLHRLHLHLLLAKKASFSLGHFNNLLHLAEKAGDINVVPSALRPFTMEHPPWSCCSYAEWGCISPVCSLPMGLDRYNCWVQNGFYNFYNMSRTKRQK